MPVIQREGFLSCPKQPCWCKLSLPERAVLDQDGAEKPSAVLASPSLVRSSGFPVNQRRLLHLQLWEMKAVMLWRGGLATLCICRSSLSRMGGSTWCSTKACPGHMAPPSRACSSKLLAGQKKCTSNGHLPPCSSWKKRPEGFFVHQPFKKRTSLVGKGEPDPLTGSQDARTT